MKLIKCDTLYDGTYEKKDCIIGFEEDKIKYVFEGRGSLSEEELVQKRKQQEEEAGAELIVEGAVVTPAFIDSHSHIGMVRSGEPEKEEEANEHMDSVYPLVNALHSIYMDDPAFKESVESGILYSTVLPGSGNVIAGKAVLIRNFVQDISQAYISDAGIKAALGYNPRSTVEWKGDRRPSTRMGAVAMLRENFIKAKKMQKLLKINKKITDEVEPLTEVFMDILSNKYKMMFHVHKEDDIMVLIELISEFGIKAIANHCVDVHREEV
jgi:imidazolonepropionase-like amidohydrolase